MHDCTSKACELSRFRQASRDFWWRSRGPTKTLLALLAPFTCFTSTTPEALRARLRRASRDFWWTGPTQTTCRWPSLLALLVGRATAQFTCCTSGPAQPSCKWPPTQFTCFTSRFYYLLLSLLALRVCANSNDVALRSTGVGSWQAPAELN